MGSEKIPRRLRRFKEGEGKSKTGKSALAESLLEEMVKGKDLKRESTNLALKEVRNFREKHKRYPNQKEFDEIAENIYAQLKESYEKEARERRAEKIGEEKPKERKGSFLERRRRRRDLGKETLKEEAPRKKGRRRGETVEEEKPVFVKEEPLIKPAEEKELSIEGLFEKEVEEGEKVEELSLPELAMSEEIASLEEDLELINDDTEAINKELETTKNKCPSCGSKAENIIFCPECGSGFCTHCAKRIEVLEDKIKYVCPKCGNEFKVKKLTR